MERRDSDLQRGNGGNVQTYRPRTPVDYSPRKHAQEQIQGWLSGRQWPAALAYRLGLQRRPPVVEAHDAVISSAHYTGPPLRIAFASDFHAGPTTHPSVLMAACAVLRAAQPDVLLLGGDFVTYRADYIDPLAEWLGQIPAPFGRFAVMGNHDIWADDHPIIQRLTANGINILMNNNVRLAPPYDQVWICGLDDVRSGSPDATGALLGAEGVRIVLMHSPAGLGQIEQERFDLALCGHTHGGQITTRSGRPIKMSGGPYNRSYLRGRFAVGKKQESTLIVSRGVGYVGLPLRLYADPDIVICTVQGNVLGGLQPSKAKTR